MRPLTLRRTPKAARALLVAGLAHGMVACLKPSEERAPPAATIAAASAPSPSAPRAASPASSAAASPGADAAVSPASSAAASPASSAAASPASSAAASPGADAAASPGADAAVHATESLLAADGTPLPQLDVRPAHDSPALLRRMRLVLDAIVRDDPAVALPAFFPVVAYEQVKAIEKPARDWQVRLVRAFERNIHEYHRRLAKAAQSLRFVALEIPDAGIPG